MNSLSLPGRLSLAATLITATLGSSVSAEEHEIQWDVSPSATALSNVVNDTVDFLYDNGHTVHEFPDETAYNNCDFSNSIELGGEGPTTVFFPNTAVRRFGCSVSTHCAIGQKLEVTTTEAPPPTDSIDWSFGASQPVIVNDEGDTLEFDYLGTGHNVYEFPSQQAFDTCDFSSAVFVGTSGPTVVNFPTGGTRWFGCQIGSHCSSGSMRVMVQTESSLLFADGFESGNTDNW